MKKYYAKLKKYNIEKCKCKIGNALILGQYDYYITIDKDKIFDLAEELGQDIIISKDENIEEYNKYVLVIYDDYIE